MNIFICWYVLVIKWSVLFGHKGLFLSLFFLWLPVDLMDQSIWPPTQQDLEIGIRVSPQICGHSCWRIDSPKSIQCKGKDVDLNPSIIMHQLQIYSTWWGISDPRRSSDVGYVDVKFIHTGVYTCMCIFHWILQISFGYLHFDMINLV